MKPKTKSPPSLPPGVNALLKPAQVAAALSFSVPTLYRMIDRGEFPRSESPPGTDPRWRISTFNDWVDKNFSGRDNTLAKRQGG